MHKNIQPRGWPRPKGYSNGVFAKARCCSWRGKSAGTNARSPESDDFVRQTEQALQNIVAALEGGRRKNLRISRA